MRESYLYLVEIVGIGVKVGISTDPARRLASHARDASAYGRTIGRTWVSDVPHANARENESAIKRGSRREYLDRAFEDCLEQALDLDMQRATLTNAADAPLNQFLTSILPAFGDYLDRKDSGR